MIDDAIKSFTGHYAFLSNGYLVSVPVGELTARSVEHAFHAAKTQIMVERIWVLDATRPFGQDGAKSRGRRVTLRDDWDEPASKHSACLGMLVKEAVMLYFLRLKFSHSDLGALLLETEERDLEEGNNHGDTFWGTVDGEGKNILGHLLMQVRSELQVVYGLL